MSNNIHTYRVNVQKYMEKSRMIQEACCWAGELVDDAISQRHVGHTQGSSRSRASASRCDKQTAQRMCPFGH